MFCVAVAIRAKHRGRSAVAWFWISWFITPVLGICLLLILPERYEPPMIIDERTIESRKQDGLLAVAIAAPVIVVVLFCLAAPFIFH